MKKYQLLQDKLNHLEFQLSKNHSLYDRKKAEENIEALYEAIDAAQDTLDELLSNNGCGRHNSAIKDAHALIIRVRHEIRENEDKFRENQISAAEISSSCLKIHSEIAKAKGELEVRMRRGLGLSILAGADKIFRQHFALIFEGEMAAIESGNEWA
mmetsp:Transcript_31171/g.53264  ORF Transcript_31171/g.53264 Transcript_31171/m.53264 type:complete len:156 (+) Transcript_31171:111-578(+)